MVTDHSNGRLVEISTCAKEHDLLESFNETYSRLENYLVKGYQITLYSDFASLSMEFSITNEGKVVLYDGFIFHGPHDGNESGGAPILSVSLSTDKKGNWF